MPTFIVTGSDKCRVLNLVECPVCGTEYELSEGIFVYSATLCNEVKVCAKHANTSLTVADEVSIQDAIQAAKNNSGGFIQVDGKSVKDFEGYEKVPKQIRNFLET